MSEEQCTQSAGCVLYAGHTIPHRYSVTPIVDATGDAIPTTYAPGYKRGGGEIRLLNPYLGETFATLDEAKTFVAEEEHDRYLAVVYFEVRPVAAASSPSPVEEPK